MANILHDHWFIGDDVGAADNAVVANAYGIVWAAQTFVASGTYTISSVMLRVGKNGNPAGNFNISIQTTTTIDIATAKPSGVEVCGGSIANSSIPGSVSNITVSISSPTLLTSGIIYAIVMSAPSGDGFNMVRIRGDNSGTKYNTGHLMTSSNSGGTWGAVDTTEDALFRTYSYAETIEAAGDISFGIEFSGDADLLEIMDAIGDIAASFILYGTASLTGTARLFWPPTRPAAIADEDTLHNNTLIAVGYDDDGIGIIYFKET